jgi:hypothetical protein
MNFQVGINRGVQTQFQFNEVCGTPNAAHNFTVYNIQSLHSGNHTLDLTLLNATGVNSIGSTIFNFNYAVVDETTQATSSTVPLASLQLQFLRHPPLPLLSRSQSGLNHLTPNNL